ncbi:MAG TPA: PQQ-dependent sugar dehydrogenase, partial [Vicinamibacteria bacterium]
MLARSRPFLLRLSLALASAAAAGEGVAQTVTDPNLTVTPVVSGLSSPTTMAFVGPGDILVLQKNNGQVRRVLNGALQPAPVLDFPVNAESERGLLGIAVSSTVNPPQVFLYVTEAASDGATAIANRVYRYNWNAGAGTLTNPALVLDLPVTAGPNHDGGVLTVDGSGRLYAVIGDLNRNGQLQNNAGGAAPDDTSVILRVNADGTAAAGNPFAPHCSVTTTQTCATNANCPGGETCRTQVGRYYAYGVRNSFGMAIDPVTSALWNTENGPSSYDEINRVTAGFNSGWNPLMGPDSRDPQGVGNLFNMPGAGLTYSDPEFSWLTPVAVTAILFPRGISAVYDDMALVGDSNNGNLYRFPLNPARDGFNLAAFTGLSDLVADDVTEREAVRIGSGFNGITDLEQGPDGAIYVVSIGNGAIYRIAGGGRDYHTVTPCRLVDTRTSTPLASGIERLFTLTGGTCGVPSSARALALNVTVTGPTGQGFVTLFPGNFTLPTTSNLNFSAGQTRANNTVTALSTNGQGTVRAFASVTGPGTVHLIIDVAGYFQ